MNRVYTIGHSNHAPEEFIHLLSSTGIQYVVDVRSEPTSARFPHVNRSSLERSLPPEDIRYLYLGDALGGRPKDPDCYDDTTGKPDYAAIQRKEWFQAAIGRLVEGVENGYRIAVMCSEEDPSRCHRNLLVGEALRKEGVEVLHIRGDGRVQTEEDLLKEKAGLPAEQYSLPLGDI